MTSNHPMFWQRRCQDSAKFHGLAQHMLIKWRCSFFHVVKQFIHQNEQLQRRDVITWRQQLPPLWCSSSSSPSALRVWWVGWISSPSSFIQLSTHMCSGLFTHTETVTSLGCFLATYVLLIGLGCQLEFVAGMQTFHQEKLSLSSLLSDQTFQT